MGSNGTRRLGTVLMSIGLLLILTVAGYFAWTEVQAAQVRTELAGSAVEAAARVTRVVEARAETSPTSAADAQQQGKDAMQAAAAVKAAPTATPRATELAPTKTPAPTATPRATGVARSRPTATAARPTRTPAPTATAAIGEHAAETSVAPVRMVIPDLKIDTKVVEMGWEVVQTKAGPISQWVIPKNVAGHHVNSAGIGQVDNLVISGHNNIYGRVFMPISQAWNNDTREKVDAFTDRSPALDGRILTLFDAAGNQHDYIITDFYRLKDTGVSQQQRETNGRFILPTEDERVTIITCWPPTNNTHRLVVIARPMK